MIDLSHLNMALSTLLGKNIPIHSVDFDSRGGFRIICGLDAGQWASVELTKMNGLYVRTDEEVNRLRTRLDYLASEVDDAGILISSVVTPERKR